MSAASIGFAQRHPEPYNGPREMFLLSSRLTELETHVNSTMPHLATKDDLNTALNQVADGLRTQIKDEVRGLDKKIDALRAEVGTFKTEMQTVRTEIQTVRTEIQTVRTEIQKEQKSARTLLLTIGGSIIATVIATSLFGARIHRSSTLHSLFRSNPLLLQLKSSMN